LLADEFFSGFFTPEKAWKVNAPTIATYIRDRVAAGELTEWTVALISNAGGEPWTFGGIDTGLTVRSLNSSVSDVDKAVALGTYSIRRILNPPDEWLDLEDRPEEIRQALELAREIWRNNGGKSTATGKPVNEPERPSGVAVRTLRSRQRGMLVIYPLQWPVGELAGVGVTKQPMIGFAVSFPFSPDAPAVDYVVNRRYLDELFGDEDE
jgi:hypothetical protein